jgi:hypothetical protein
MVSIFFIKLNSFIFPLYFLNGSEIPRKYEEEIKIYMHFHYHS